MSCLQNGQQFPGLRLPTVGGATLTLPSDLSGRWGVVLIYRGAWCPYCTAQLATFSRMSKPLSDAGISVVAFSVDDEAVSADLVAKLDIQFPLAFGADPRLTSELLGSYLGDDGDGAYLQSTGFLLRPDGTIAVVVYSSEAIGRLSAADVLGYVKHVRDDEATDPGLNATSR